MGAKSPWTKIVAGRRRLKTDLAISQGSPRQPSCVAADRRPGSLPAGWLGSVDLDQLPPQPRHGGRQGSSPGARVEPGGADGPLDMACDQPRRPIDLDDPRIGHRDPRSSGYGHVCRHASGVSPRPPGRTVARPGCGCRQGAIATWHSRRPTAVARPRRRTRRGARRSRRARNPLRRGALRRRWFPVRSPSARGTRRRLRWSRRPGDRRARHRGSGPLLQAATGVARHVRRWPRRGGLPRRPGASSGGVPGR